MSTPHGVRVTLSPASTAPEVEVANPAAVEVLDSAELPQPVHSVRSAIQGPRGCWAISNRTKEPCAAAARAGEDFCNAHSGVGVASDPNGYRPKAIEALRESRRVRAEVRLALGSPRMSSPRGVLKVKAFAERERLADAAIRDAKRDGRLALALIREVDPSLEARLSVSVPDSVEGVDALSPSALLELAARMGIEADPLPPAPPPPGPEPN